MNFLKINFKSFLMSLDMIIGFLAVTYSYKFYIEREADIISSLIMIITSLLYFVFYPYYLIKILDRDKVRAMASIYADLLISKQEKNEEDDKA